VGEELGVGARGEHDTGDGSGGFKILVALWVETNVLKELTNSGGEL
jgi:hypothetical protein